MNDSLDLNNCDHEPIHIPGQIQSHGFLVVIDKDFLICSISGNINGFLPGNKIDLLGLKLSDLENFFDDAIGTISNFILSGTIAGKFDPANPLPISISGIPHYMIVGLSANFYLLEFEPAVSSFSVDAQSLMGRSIAELLKHKELNKLLEVAAQQVKRIIKYDRVMVYHFGEDGHGEVVAEEHETDLQSWLGLHYPASDIPKQARELYKLNLTRLIANVHTPTSQIFAKAGTSGPLDLTNSQLRAVSPTIYNI